jgi:hypothetical protein
MGGAPTSGLPQATATMADRHLPISELRQCDRLPPTADLKDAQSPLTAVVPMDVLCLPMVEGPTVQAEPHPMVEEDTAEVGEHPRTAVTAMAEVSAGDMRPPRVTPAQARRLAAALTVATTKL